MKKLVILISGIVIMAGCKEHDAPLTLLVPSADSVYMLPASAVPSTPDAHNVLIEDFSGQSCINCIGSHSETAYLESTGNVYGICYYVNAGFVSIPPPGSKNDFRDSIGDEIFLNVYGNPSGIPVGGVDRVPVAGTVDQAYGAWQSTVNTQKRVNDSINLSVSSVLENGKFKVSVTVTYLQNLVSKQNLNVMLIEDSIVDFQAILTGSGIDSSYVFNDVFRGMVNSAPNGDVILDTTKEVRGLVDVRTYRYSMPPSNINIAHCKILAFLCNRGNVNGGDYRVIQTVECPLEQ